MRRELPDLYLEQMLLGEVSPEKRSRIMEDPCALEKLRELEESNQAILEQYDFAAMSRELEGALDEASPEESESAASPGRKNTILLPGVPLLAAAVFLAALVIPLALQPDRTPADDSTPAGIRLKGLQPELRIYRKTSDEVELLEEKNIVKNRDLLQLSYQAAGKQYGTIFSIDGNGFMTLHYPDSPSASPELNPSGEIPLDFSYQLDDAPGFERFFFVTSDSYFSVTQVLDAAARMASSFYNARNGELEVPDVCDTDSILLLKEDSHE